MSQDIIDTLEKEQDISDTLNDLDRQIKDEEKVWAEELADRQRLGLEGDAVISHYNEWMEKFRTTPLYKNN